MRKFCLLSSQQASFTRLVDCISGHGTLWKYKENTWERKLLRALCNFPKEKKTLCDSQRFPRSFVFLFRFRGTDKSSSGIAAGKRTNIQRTKVNRRKKFSIFISIFCLKVIVNTIESEIRNERRCVRRILRSHIYVMDVACPNLRHYGKKRNG